MDQNPRFSNNCQAGLHKQAGSDSLSERTSGSGSAARLAFWVALLSLSGCQKQASAPQNPDKSTATAVVAPSVSLGATTAAKGSEAFATPTAALKHIMQEAGATGPTAPWIVAFGEIHAPAGESGAKSTTKQFRESLLGAVADHLSKPSGSASLAPGATRGHTVLELWQPRSDCQREVAAKVQATEKSVTSGQASSNKNEFVLLGERSKELGYQPWLLAPTCADLGSAADAGSQDIRRMLTLTKELTIGRVKQLREKFPMAPIILYGGAMHNDIFEAAPPASDESATLRYEASFGAALAAYTGKRYLAIDLIVPEYVRDTPAFRAQPWYERVVTRESRSSAYAFALAPQSYALVLPETALPETAPK
jgi:hypothetical protein